MPCTLPCLNTRQSGTAAACQTPLLSPSGVPPPSGRGCFIPRAPNPYPFLPKPQDLARVSLTTGRPFPPPKITEPQRLHHLNAAPPLGKLRHLLPLPGVSPVPRWCSKRRPTALPATGKRPHIAPSWACRPRRARVHPGRPGHLAFGLSQAEDLGQKVGPVLFPSFPFRFPI
jgi:hypothetical protein